jgi:hypothetical protein
MLFSWCFSTVRGTGSNPGNTPDTGIEDVLQVRLARQNPAVRNREKVGSSIELGSVQQIGTS